MSRCSWTSGELAHTWGTQLPTGLVQPDRSWLGAERGQFLFLLCIQRPNKQQTLLAGLNTLPLPCPAPQTSLSLGH